MRLWRKIFKKRKKLNTSIKNAGLFNNRYQRPQGDLGKVHPQLKGWKVGDSVEVEHYNRATGDHTITLRGRIDGVRGQFGLLLRTQKGIVDISIGSIKRKTDGTISIGEISE